MPFGTLWEEVAWRAYALRKLQSKYSDITSALLLGVFWSLWHIPLWIATLHLDGHNRVLILLMAASNLTGWSVVFTYIYNCTAESLPVTILLHGALGASSTYIFAVAPATNLYVLATGMLLALLVASVFAVKMVFVKSPVASLPSSPFRQSNLR